MFVSRFSIKVCFYKAILDRSHDIKEWYTSRRMRACVTIYCAKNFFVYFLSFLIHTIPRHICNFRSLFYIYISVNSWFALINLIKTGSRNVVTQVFSRCLISPCSSHFDNHLYVIIYTAPGCELASLLIGFLPTGYQLLLCSQSLRYEQQRALIGSLLTGYQLLLYSHSLDMNNNVLWLDSS